MEFWNKYIDLKTKITQISRGEVQSREDKLGCKEQYRVEVSNRLAALEDLDTEMYINNAWETNRANFKISTKESH
jgi:hypothetical protein